MGKEESAETSECQDDSGGDWQYTTLGELTDALWAIEDWIRAVREALAGQDPQTRFPLRMSMYPAWQVPPGRRYIRGCPPPVNISSSLRDGGHIYNKGCPPPREGDGTNPFNKGCPPPQEGGGTTPYNKGCPPPVQAGCSDGDTAANPAGAPERSVQQDSSTDDKCTD